MNKDLAQYLDLANHRQEATPDDIALVCSKVREYKFNSAFVNSCYVRFAKEKLEGCGLVGTVVSFPLGQDSRDIKVLAAINATRDGADELDVSMNVGLFKAKLYDKVLDEMVAIVESAKSVRKTEIVKFIIETGCLDGEEIKKASEMVLESGADFVKTCSGMGPRGASLEDVELIKSVVGDKIRIKVAGGIDSYEEAVSFIEKGASRIGTSHAVEIVNEAKDGSNRSS